MDGDRCYWLDEIELVDSDDDADVDATGAHDSAVAGGAGTV